MEKNSEKDNEFVEEESLVGVELFYQVMENELDEDDLRRWIDNDVIECFNFSLEHGEYWDLGPAIKKSVIKELEYETMGFFVNHRCTLYLKLVNLYERLKKVEGTENQDLYYIMEKFTPHIGYLGGALQSFVTIYTKEAFDFLAPCAYYNAMNDYYLAQEIGNEMAKEEYNVEEIAEDVTEASALKEKIKETSKLFNKVVEEYTEDSAIGVLDYNCHPELLNKIDEVSLALAAKVYCDVHGSGLTEKERNVMVSEFSESEVLSMLKEVDTVQSKLSTDIKKSK